MSLNLAQLLRDSAHRVPDKTAIVLGDARLSYREIHGSAQAFAGALRQRGVAPGDHVALLVPNVPQFAIAYYGILYAGAVVVPLNVLLKAEEIHYHLEDSQAVALVAWLDCLEPASEAVADADGCRLLVAVRPQGEPAGADAGAGSQPPETTEDFSTLLAEADPLTEIEPTMPDDTAVILYTSGTTGRPKGAELTHFNSFFNAYYTSTKLLPLPEDTVALAALPLFHSFGQSVILTATLAVGGTVILLPRFDPTAALELMQEHRVTFFGGVPTMYFALLHHPEADAYDLSSLQSCVSGGAAMPVEVMTAFDEKYGVNILEGYGLSETSPVASFNVLDRPKKAGSVGIPIHGVEFRLEADDGSIVEDIDTPGEILIKGHNVMKGYFNRPEANAESIVDGWLHTGDIATRDEDGYYFIVDRKKDMIIRGGFNVYPREIEEVLYAHPAILEAAVIGAPDDRLGEEVKAVVAFRDGEQPSAEDLIAYCKERLAAYKYPRLVEILDELPKGPTGKILKRALR